MTSGDALEPTSRTLGQLLGDAFADDPLFTWAIPDERRRRRALPRMFARSLKHCDRHGGVVRRGNEAAAGWTDGQHARVSIGDALRSGLAMSPMWLGLAASRRLQQHEALVDVRMAGHLGPGSAYLMAVGTDPGKRGSGLGRACVEDVASAAEEAGHDALVLRTENPGNVGFYEHLGFEVIDQWSVSASGLEVWAFRRPLS